jgi:hypothetical protein
MAAAWNRAASVCVIGAPGVGKTLSAGRYSRWDIVKQVDPWREVRSVSMEALSGLNTIFYTPPIINTPRQIEYDIQRLRDRLKRLAFETVKTRGRPATETYQSARQGGVTTRKLRKRPFKAISPVSGIRTVIADAAHESRKLARASKQHQGWQLQIVRWRQRAFKITGVTWPRGTQLCVAGEDPPTEQEL